jgi:hypothetical protein
MLNKYELLDELNIVIGENIRIKNYAYELQKIHIDMENQIKILKLGIYICVGFIAILLIYGTYVP